MIVEPAPAGPRSGHRRGLRIAGLVVPVVLLVGAVIVGITGPPASPTPTLPPPAPPAAAVAQPSPGQDGGVAVVPVAFPAVAADLAVRTVGDAQAWLGNDTTGPVAVAGWLTNLHPDGACPAAGGDTRGVLGPLCDRRARLDSDPTADAADQYVYVDIPPGTRLPASLEGSRLPDAVPVVLVGHTGDFPHPCIGDQNACRSDLDVDRVTWADGTDFDPGPVYDAYLEMAPPWMMIKNLMSAETLAIGWSGTVLQAALIRPSTVGRVDPAAAQAMARKPTPAGLVWYVLGLETGYDPIHALHGEAPPRYSWVVLDYTTGDALARGPVYPATAETP
jgi:hypothetical protein